MVTGKEQRIFNLSGEGIFFGDRYISMYITLPPSPSMPIPSGSGAFMLGKKTGEERP
jgi:hypothetical protein